jgi:hypothetical protein
MSVTTDSESTYKKLFSQRNIPWIGALNQLFGAAMGWVSMATFAFSGVAAWNTDTMAMLRDNIPWLNLGLFIGAVVAVIAFAMWLQHKYVQSSTVDYWRKMFYEDNPSLERQKALEKIIIQYVITDEKFREEAIKILDEATKSKN